MGVLDDEQRLRLLELWQRDAERELRALRRELDKCVGTVGQLDVAAQVATGVSQALASDAEHRATVGHDRATFRFSLVARVTAATAALGGIVSTIVLLVEKF